MWNVGLARNPDRSKANLASAKVLLKSSYSYKWCAFIHTFSETKNIDWVGLILLLLSTSLPSFSFFFFSLSLSLYSLRAFLSWDRGELGIFQLTSEPGLMANIGCEGRRFEVLRWSSENGQEGNNTAKDEGFAGGGAGGRKEIEFDVQGGWVILSLFSLALARSLDMACFHLARVAIAWTASDI